MTNMQFGGALALSLLLVSCGENDNAVVGNRSGADVGAAAAQTGEIHSATGEVTAIVGDQVTVAHGPVEAIGWPAMTMTFRAQPPEMVEGLAVGDQVSFEFKQDGGSYVLTSISKDR